MPVLNDSDRTLAELDTHGKLLRPKPCDYAIYLNDEVFWGTFTITEETVFGRTTYRLTLKPDENSANSCRELLAKESGYTIDDYDFSFYKFDEHGEEVQVTDLKAILKNLLQFLSCYYYRKITNVKTSERDQYSSWLDCRDLSSESRFYPSGATGIVGDTPGKAGASRYYVEHLSDMREHVRAFAEFNEYVELYFANMDQSTIDPAHIRHVSRPQKDRTANHQRVRDNLYAMHAITRMFRPFTGYDHKTDWETRLKNYVHAREAMTNVVETLAYLDIPDDQKFVPPPPDPEDLGDFPEMMGSKALFIDKTLFFAKAAQ